MKRPLHEILQPFSPGRIGDAILLFEALAAEGYGIASLKRHLAQRMELMAQRREALSAEQAAFMVDLDKHSPKCPECGRTMTLFGVNVSPRTMIGGAARSIWQCPDIMGCGHEEESERTVLEEHERIGIKGPGWDAIIKPTDSMAPRPARQVDRAEYDDPGRIREKRRAAADARRMATNRRRR
jgi:hypothetical protein